MLVTPADDPKFPTSTVHGVDPQRDLYREVMRAVKQRRTAIDAGAHIGLWTLMLGEDFAKVFAFEPNEENHACLVQNVRKSDTNIVTARYALGASKDTASQKLPPHGNSGCWHLVPGADFEILPLDIFELTDVDLIKIDVEGFEGQVILGARQTITASKPTIVLEANGTGPKYFGAAWVDPTPHLVALGYRRKLRWRKDEIWIPR